MTPAERRQLAAAYVPLALAMARRKYGRGVEPDELRAAAFLGLAKAAQVHDEQRGAWVAFARMMIGRELRSVIANAGLVALPKDLRRAAWQVTAARQAFIGRHGRAPDRAELAEESGLPLRFIDALVFRTVSLDAPIGREDGSELHELVADGRAHSPELVARDREIGRVVDAALPRLDAAVARARWMADEEPSSIRAIADRLGVSDTEVANAERRAARRLRRVLA